VPAKSDIQVVTLLIVPRKFPMCLPGHTPPVALSHEGRLRLDSAGASHPTPKLLHLLDQCGQFLASVKHAGFHSGGWDGENLRAFFDRPLVIVDKVDDLAVFGGELC
jgi:hypothetical protein